MRNKRRALRMLGKVSQGKNKKQKQSKASIILFLSKKMVLVLVIKKEINRIVAAASEDINQQMVDL